MRNHQYSLFFGSILAFDTFVHMRFCVVYFLMQEKWWNVWDALKEFLTPEVLVLQEQMSTLQVKLDEEEHKNVKLQQQIDKLEHHSTQMQEVRLQAWPQKMSEPQSKNLPGRQWLRKLGSRSIWVVFSYFVISATPLKRRHTPLVWI